MMAAKSLCDIVSQVWAGCIADMEVYLQGDVSSVATCAPHIVLTWACFVDDNEQQSNIMGSITLGDQKLQGLLKISSGLFMFGVDIVHCLSL